ncbi:MAG: hypothetical protein ACYC35_15890 [Pirellulales bacterium]
MFFHRFGIPLPVRSVEIALRAKCFLDTNVIVYANDRRDPRKQAPAVEIVTDCMGRREGVVSTQGLQEYVVAAEKKLHLAMSSRKGARAGGEKGAIRFSVHPGLSWVW